MKGVAMRGNNQAILSYAGLLTLLEPNFYTPANGRTAYITTISNTGWMWGGNRGAFLCDTDPTAINTTNLVNATQLSHRNLIINGAMQVAQRATSSTTSLILSRSSSTS